MRVNVYQEELTDQTELLQKRAEGRTLYGIRFYLHLPVTQSGGRQTRGPFLHGEEDDDSSAVTFWSDNPNELRAMLARAVEHLDESMRP